MARIQLGGDRAARLSSQIRFGRNAEGDPYASFSVNEFNGKAMIRYQVLVKNGIDLDTLKSAEPARDDELYIEGDFAPNIRNGYVNQQIYASVVRIKSRKIGNYNSYNSNELQVYEEKKVVSEEPTHTTPSYSPSDFNDDDFR